MLDSPLSRHAGPLALAAGVLIVVAQLVMLPFDPDDHVATSTDPAFQIGGVVYMVGFCVLMLALIGAYGWGLHKAPGRLGVIAFVTAIVGTMLLGGDLWFETFAVPWLADEAPASLDTDPTTLLAIGAIASYLSFAVGWLLVGDRKLPGSCLPDRHLRRHRDRGRYWVPCLAVAHRHPPRCCRRMAGRVDDQDADRGHRDISPRSARGPLKVRITLHAKRWPWQQARRYADEHVGSVTPYLFGPIPMRGA